MTSKKYSKEVFGNRLKKIARKLTRKNHTQKLKKKNTKRQKKKTQKGSGAESSKPEPVELESISNSSVANQEELPDTYNENDFVPINRGNNEQNNIAEKYRRKVRRFKCIHK